MGLWWSRRLIACSLARELYLYGGRTQPDNCAYYTVGSGPEVTAWNTCLSEHDISRDVGLWPTDHAQGPPGMVALQEIPTLLHTPVSTGLGFKKLSNDFSLGGYAAQQTT
ncbi:hypothetical protein MPER_11867 [Moniliophthora perniciosa FA553]|nr:hypothetical protein MPER_11867 [Moniliophthora perniciosa FA553]